MPWAREALVADSWRRTDYRFRAARESLGCDVRLGQLSLSRGKIWQVVCRRFQGPNQKVHTQSHEDYSEVGNPAEYMLYSGTLNPVLKNRQREFVLTFPSWPLLLYEMYGMRSLQTCSMTAVGSVPRPIGTID